MNDFVLRLNEITFGYSERHILEKVTLSIKKGERISLVGPSGVGKSTLLRLISGLLKQSSGDIERFYQRSALVFQDYRLLPWRTLLQNVTYPLGQASAEDDADARKLLENVGLGGLANRFPAQLSGGQQQRAQLARALIVRPELLLLDEFTSSLDSETALSIEKLLSEMWSIFGFSLVLVTHDLLQAKRLTDSVYILGPHGRLEQILANAVKSHSAVDRSFSRFGM